MSGIDLRTINFMTGLMCVVMGIVILGMRHNFPSAIKGMGLWGLGVWRLCGGMAMMLVEQGAVPVAALPVTVTPVSVSVPMTMPTMAQALPTGSAFLAPSASESRR